MNQRTIRSTLTASSLIIAALVSSSAQAALLDRGGGLIYDTDLNVTWLQDANYAKTSGYIPSGYETGVYNFEGAMTWDQANIWASNLSYYDIVRNVTYTDWRLPTVNPVNGIARNDDFNVDGSTDFGFNISKPGTVYAGSTGSEMAHLYYVDLGNLGVYTPGGGFSSSPGHAPVGVSSGCYVNDYDTCLNNFGPFINFRENSNFDTYWSDTGYERVGGFAWGFTFGNGGQSYFNKDLGFHALAVRPGDVAAVPEAQTYALMLAGLGLIGWRARRRG